MDDLTTELDLDAIRVFLHLLGVCGWVGGQLVMGALVPVLRKVSPEAPRLAAARFGRIAWACFALAVVTGVWGLAAAAIHGTTNSVVVRAATGAAAALTALGALLAGAILVA